jgi:nitrile hydratase accessory protein
MSQPDTDLPPIAPDEDGPIFRAPWEAQSFAMALALHRAGLFRWREWAAMLAEEIQRAQRSGDPDTGQTYYRHWQATLERMIVEKGLSDAQAIDRYSSAWAQAARRTPHGKPIELGPEDFAAPIG